MGEEEQKQNPPTLQAPPLAKMKVEGQPEEVDTSKVKTGFVKEDENDWNEDGYDYIPYDDELIDPIEDFTDYEGRLIDDDVVYRLRANYSHATRSELGTEKELVTEVVQAVPLKGEDTRSLREEEVQATRVVTTREVEKKVVVETFDDESKLLVTEKRADPQRQEEPQELPRFERTSFSQVPNPNKSLISHNASMNKSFTRGSKQKIFMKSHIEMKKRLESIDKNNIDILGSLIENEEEYKRGSLTRLRLDQV